MDIAGKQRYLENMQSEVDSAALYRTMARVEKKPELQQVYNRLAEVEEKHARFWQQKLTDIGSPTAQSKPGLRTRMLCRLVHWFGPAFLAPAITAFEQKDSSAYDDQPEAVLGGLPAAERAHAKIMKLMTTMPVMDASKLAQVEGRHRGLSGGNALRAAVLGANDGLASNLSLVMAVAGASMDSHSVLITGLAGLLAGSCSMAMGEWLSVNSSRESYQQQIAIEASELEQFPEEEKEELVLIYRAKGLPEDQARTMVDHMLTNKETALDTLVREELGINPDDLGGSAWEAALSSFVLFATGAIFPVLPYFFLSGSTAVLVSLILSGVALFGIGAVTTLFTGRGVLYTGARQLLIGYLAAAITFGIGHLIGVALT